MSGINNYLHIFRTVREIWQTAKPIPNFSSITLKIHNNTSISSYITCHFTTKSLRSVWELHWLSNFPINTAKCLIHCTYSIIVYYLIWGIIIQLLKFTIKVQTDICSENVIFTDFCATQAWHKNRKENFHRMKKQPQ